MWRVQGKTAGPGEACVLVNNEWVSPDTLLKDGDLIALAPHAEVSSSSNLSLLAN